MKNIVDELVERKTIFKVVSKDPFSLSHTVYMPALCRDLSPICRVLYAEGMWTYPNIGLLTGFDSVISAACFYLGSPLNKSLWQATADVVKYGALPAVILAKIPRTDYEAEWFWRSRFANFVDGCKFESAIAVPAGTILCTRIKLVRKLTK